MQCVLLYPRVCKASCLSSTTARPDGGDLDGKVSIQARAARLSCAGAGQVLEEEEYLRRKEYYQESGQRHYYFMNIGNGEVIDAARKVRSHTSARAEPA